jgi:hypothetical protein
MDERQGNWSALRELRANRPHKADQPSDRAQVFGAAMHQFEELMRAAESVDFAARPLPLFYAISQAGRAITAARGEEPWELSGHGLKHTIKQTLLQSLVKPESGTKDSFSRVCEATGNGHLTGPVELGGLWASLPELFTVDLPEEAWRRPLRVIPKEVPIEWLALERDIFSATIAALPNRVLEGLEGHALGKALADELAWYPQSEGWELRPGPGAVRLVRNEGYGWDAYVRWPVESPGERALVEARHAPEYRGPQDRWLRPVLNESGDRLSPLMTWWALLYGLSRLARYHPGPWTQSLDVDACQLAVPLEVALDEALESVPRLVLTALRE